MEQTKRQQAEHLYFKTDLSKSEIAENLGISRTTLDTWISQDNWEYLKRSSNCMPVFLAQNLYFAIGNLTEHILSPERAGQPVTRHEANTIHRLTLTAEKLKNRATTSELMQAFTCFAERLTEADPALAGKVMPYLHAFIEGDAAALTRGGNATAPPQPAAPQTKAPAPGNPAPASQHPATPAPPQPASKVPPAPQTGAGHRAYVESALRQRLRTGGKIHPNRQDKAA